MVRESPVPSMVENVIESGFSITVAVLTCLTLAQPVNSALQAGLVEPVKPLSQSLRAFQLYSLTQVPYEQQSFEQKLTVALLDSELPALDQQWLQAFCQFNTKLQGQDWQQLRDEQKLAIANEMLARLKLILHPASLQALGNFDDIQALQAKIDQLPDQKAVYAEVDRRVITAFPQFEGHLELIVGSEFDQIFLAALSDVLANRSGIADQPPQGTDYGL